MTQAWGEPLGAAGLDIAMGDRKRPSTQGPVMDLNAVHATREHYNRHSLKYDNRSQVSDALARASSGRPRRRRHLALL